MATHSKHNVEILELAALYLRITVDEHEQVFALYPGDERVVAVGSASSADIQLEGPGISPIHFYFERIENEIWIVPAYCVSELRVNAARVSSPSHLGHRSIVEFGSTRIVVDVSSAPFNQVGTPATPRSDHTERVRRSYLAQLPSDDEPTRQPCGLSDKDVPTVQAWIGNDRNCDACLETSTITLIAPKRSAGVLQKSPKQLPERHEESSSSLAKTLLRHSNSSAASKDLESLPTDGQLCTSTADSTTSYEIVNVAPLDKTLVGIAPLMPVINESKQNSTSVPRLKANATAGSSNPSQIATLFDGPPVPNLAHRKKSWLTRLGLLAKRYPVRVCIAAFLIALAGSGAVVLAAKVVLAKRGNSAIQMPSAHNPHVAQESGKPDLPRIDPPKPPSVEVASAGPTRPELAQESSPKGGSTAEFGKAALSLVQGHYAEAQAAYASLAARSPEDRTYAAIAQLLARRLAPRCADEVSSNHATSCPEVKQ